MAQDYTNYLAANVLNDGIIVTYRSLARACKILMLTNSMLYDFHATQNAEKPGSVHATYLISGVQPSKAIVDSSVAEENNDVHMHSSPFMSSPMPRQVAEEDVSVVKVVTLVQEQHLSTVKVLYDTICSVHVYSLEPSPIQDLQVLSDVKREIAAKHASEDPLLIGPQYGTIGNPRRRTGPKPICVAAASTVASNRKKGVKPVSHMIPIASNGIVHASQSQMRVETKHERSQDAYKKVTSKKQALKREQSDIFKSFSNPKRKTIQEGTESSVDATSTPATPKMEALDTPQDELMVDALEDEQEEDIKDLSESALRDDQFQRNSKLDRAEALRKMMDDEDEPMQNASEASVQVGDHSSPTDALQQPEAVTEPLAIASGGRRRGRRKVMKKKTIKDEEGYLVTKEEATWESFSEDEPTRVPQVKTPLSSGSSSAAGKVKKMGGRSGQGNIMSFFGKR
ncbi:hypothetical protein MMC26_007741 [Xylographa opegraphella]|nr:hypothetical protein [Xylographa opegraphella]